MNAKTLKELKTPTTPAAFRTAVEPWLDRAVVRLLAQTRDVADPQSLLEVLVCQAADETGYRVGGTPTPGGAPPSYNLTGLSLNGRVLSFQGHQQFVAWEVAYLAPNPAIGLDQYRAVREAKGFDAIAQALGVSPWAGGHYRDPAKTGAPGSALIKERALLYPALAPTAEAPAAAKGVQTFEGPLGGGVEVRFEDGRPAVDFVPPGD